MAQLTSAKRLASGMSLNAVVDLAAQLRVDSVRASTSAGSGHPTSSMSAAVSVCPAAGRGSLRPGGVYRLAGRGRLMLAGSSVATAEPPLGLSA